MALLSAYALAVSLLTVPLILHLFRIGRRETGLPPGPSTLPLVGNLHQLPQHGMHLQFTTWAKEFGGIFSLKFGSGTVIVATSPRAVRELIDQKSASTSDRPPSHFSNVVTGGNNLGFARYSDYWRRGRRVMHSMLTKKACINHLNIQRAEASQLMYDYLVEPKDFVAHGQRYANSVITSILAGTRSPHRTSPLVTSFFKMQHEWTNLLEPGAHPPVDMVPFLKYIPGNWKQICAKMKASQEGLYGGLIDACARRVESGMRNGCFLEEVRENKDVDRGLLRGMCSALMEGGSDSTSIYLQSFVLMLVAHPDVQVKARAEIDSVVGLDRLPDIEDMDNLPYVSAVIKEVLRLRPITALGAPHYSTQPEIIDGYMIPKDSMIFINQWGMLHDPDSYDQPDSFIPERFLTSPFGTKPGADDTSRSKDIFFGGGRRICVGMHLGQNSLAITSMYLIWAFTFSNAIDPQTKKPIPVDINEYDISLNTIPKPFKCDIQVRSEEHKYAIEHAFADARLVFAPFEQDLRNIGHVGI
ncbi:cytochrome P450 [Guyanagaster necrorhizus]|uniref:Cytochrome P450 n=1 Tax=Guyanagaster necrorhizus TaxID=856835 RepID=A0A9P7W308_9AGAR|nr:cytochrome P450 [Guyanagaster necrorhizus MCA 3950]KAG7451644.1 cytochrome P450 [Guyanagaster necrorhizus MCA 3950]